MKIPIAIIRGILPVLAVLDLLAWFVKWFGHHGYISSKNNWIFGLFFLFFIGSFLVLEYQKARREDREREQNQFFDKK